MAAMQSMTREPESAEVTKRRTMAKSEKTANRFPITGRPTTYLFVSLTFIVNINCILTRERGHGLEPHLLHGKAGQADLGAVGKCSAGVKV